MFFFHSQFYLNRETYLSSVHFSPVSVSKVLKHLKPTTSVGPDGIPNILLKNCASSLAVPLCLLFDTSFKDGVLPDCWKKLMLYLFTKKAAQMKPITIDPSH